MKHTKILLLLAVIMVLGQACKKNNTELGDYSGIAICASDNFEYTTPFRVNGSTTPSAIDFRVAPYGAILTAQLSEKVSWTIAINGITSGAIKTFSGLSDNVNVKWFGNSDKDVFFITGEQVTITFTPSCESSVSVPLTISHASTFTSYGTLLADFDNIYLVYTYNSVDVNVAPWVRNLDTLFAPADASPQGKKAHKMYGPEGHTGWYIAGFGQSVDLSTVLGNSLTPENVYINAYILGGSTTSITIDIVETVGTDDYHFKKSFPVTWRGWKLVTYKLSDFYIGNPLKVKSLDFTAGPTVFNAETECYIDFIIFTKDKPFTGTN